MSKKMELLQELLIHKFEGGYPDVPLADGIDLEELKKADGEPMFVTLPIVPEIGAISKNGLLYDEALVNSIVEQINSKRPGGNYGHLNDPDKEFPKAEALWVGAIRDKNSVWGKAYVPPGAARDDIRRKKAVGGQIATSIYGTAKYEQVKPGVRRASPFILEKIDFAPPERAALRHGFTPVITAEFETNEEPEMDKETLLAELTATDIPDPIREAIIAEYRQTSDRKNEVAELKRQAADKDSVIETLQEQLAKVSSREFETQLNDKVSELIDWDAKGDEAKKKVESFRRMVSQRIVSELNDEKDNLDEAAEMVWAEMKPLAETLRDALAGPPAFVGGKTLNGYRQLDDSPAARRKARATVGL